MEISFTNPKPIEISPSLWIVNLYYAHTEEWPCLFLFGTYPIFLSNFWVPQIYGTRSRSLLFCTRCGLICSIRIFLCHNICRTSFRKRIIYSTLMYYFYSLFVFYQFYFCAQCQYRKNIIKIFLIKFWWEVVLPSYAADKPILPSDW